MSFNCSTLSCVQLGAAGAASGIFKASGVSNAPGVSSASGVFDASGGSNASGIPNASGISSARGGGGVGSWCWRRRLWRRSHWLGAVARAPVGELQLRQGLQRVDVVDLPPSHRFVLPNCAKMAWRVQDARMREVAVRNEGVGG